MQPTKLGPNVRLVMPGLVPGIHVLAPKTWMAGTGPAMTKSEFSGVALKRFRPEMPRRRLC